jgi:hypothetical protein
MYFACCISNSKIRVGANCKLLPFFNEWKIVTLGFDPQASGYAHPPVVTVSIHHDSPATNHFFVANVVEVTPVAFTVVVQR